MLTLVIVGLIAARMLGFIEVPGVWFASAIAVELALVSIETTAFVVVLRHFYRQHRRLGATRWDAFGSACGDELYAAGAPRWAAMATEWSTRRQGHLARWFARLVGKLVAPRARRRTSD